ncbi:hypothetical protein VB796_02110 [Arcicella sp. LKC2W]|uniref:hypothetical protein n=1 Tax=Arcicella sp. LKC2W TaxID=2984198 RepID=UPI002B21B42C|nr:hypothetical protein [Arcicella sp. LKC2W]MEA5457812.1 hypothetical protein [Arcicella sp. LKC2W]
MKQFLFNDITPNPISNAEIINAFKNTIVEYKSLKEKFPNYIDGIICSTQLNNINLTKDLTLADSLELIDNKEIKDYSFSIFTKYPIENFLDIETVLTEENNYHFVLNTNQEDALFIKIISNENGILFSLNLHSDLAKDSLVINSSNTTSFSVDNLYGLKSNTDIIEETIKNEELSKLGNLDKLKTILNNPTSSKKFDNTFSKMSKEIQDLIIEGFETIINYKKNGFNIPETLLRDVTHKNETIKELKMRDPIAKRLYFKEIDGIYYLASLEDKPLKDRLTKEQNSHIKNAISILKELKNK